eukprot:4623149-Amphidinium_carterae.2
MGLMQHLWIKLAQEIQVSQCMRSGSTKRRGRRHHRTDYLNPDHTVEGDCLYAALAICLLGDLRTPPPMGLVKAKATALRREYLWVLVCAGDYTRAWDTAMGAWGDIYVLHRWQKKGLRFRLLDGNGSECSTRVAATTTTAAATTTTTATTAATDAATATDATTAAAAAANGF